MWKTLCAASKYTHQTCSPSSWIMMTMMGMRMKHSIAPSGKNVDNPRRVMAQAQAASHLHPLDPWSWSISNFVGRRAHGGKAGETPEHQQRKQHAVQPTAATPKDISQARNAPVYKKPRIIVPPRGSNVPLNAAEEWQNVTQCIDGDPWRLVALVLGGFMLWGVYGTAKVLIRGDDDEPGALFGLFYRNRREDGQNARDSASLRSVPVLRRVLQQYPALAEEFHVYVQALQGTGGAALLQQQGAEDIPLGSEARFHADAVDILFKNEAYLRLARLVVARMDEEGSEAPQQWRAGAMGNGHRRRSSSARENRLAVDLREDITRRRRDLQATQDNEQHLFE